jgi:hypothetical protein
MKKIFVLTVAFIAGIAFTANAEQITTGQMAKCNDAKSITLENSGAAATMGAKDGYTDNDRGGANVVVWKSSNFTSVPLTLSPNDDNNSVNGADHGLTGLPQRGGMGKSKITLVSQNNFSRGDSIGDISGLVKITNTGLTPVTVSCN